MIPLIIFLWFYVLIGFGVCLSVTAQAINNHHSLPSIIVSNIIVIVAWPYLLGVRLMG